MKDNQLQIGTVLDRPTLMDIPFDSDAVDLDDIVPYVDQGDETRLTERGTVTVPAAQVMLEILQTRRDIGELIFAREEELAIAEMHAIAAEDQEERAGKKGMRIRDKRRLLAEARRNRVLEKRSIWRARHRELQILAHLQRKVA